MINATVARENAKTFRLTEKEKVIMATNEWLDTTVSKEIERVSKDGFTTLTIWYKNGIDKTVAINILVDYGYKAEEKITGALTIQW
jgi:hypothetical protein